MSDEIYRDTGVVVTSTLVLITGTTYAVSTINSVRVTVKAGGTTAGGYILIVLSCIFGLIAAACFFSGSYPPAFIFTATTIGLIIGANKSVDKTTYTLLFATSSGETPALVAEDEGRIVKIRDAIMAAMASAREVTPSRTMIGENTINRERASAAAPTTPDPSGETMTCPECAETIKAAAKVCRFCGHRLMRAIN